MAVRTNRITNPSFETNNTLWTANGGATLTRVTAQHYVGAAAGQVVCTAVANSGVQSNTYTVGVGVGIAAGIAVKGNAGGETTTLELRNQANTVFATVGLTLTTSWQYFTLTGTTPAATTSVHLRTNKTAATAHTYFVDAVILEQAATLASFFDGASVDDLVTDYAWTGTANLSTSTATEKAPIAVTGYTNAAPSPRVEIVLASIPGTAVTTTVVRSVAGKQATVRGALKGSSIGGFAVTDYEAPLNVPITYIATSYNSGGGAVSQSPISATVTLTDSSAAYMWISDPLQPSSALKMLVEVGTAASLTYTAPAETLAPIGRPEPIAVIGTRRIAGGVQVRLASFTLAEAAAARDLLDSAGVLCLRPAVSQRMPALGYVAPADIVETPVGYAGAVVWSLDSDLVAASGATVMVPFHTYAELLDAHSTYAEVLAAKATYLDVLRNPV